MSTSASKRRRIQDSGVAPSQRTVALDHLEVLKGALQRIEELEESGAIAEHVLALESILKDTKKPRVDFSTVTDEELEKAGVRRKRLIFKAAKISELTEELTPGAMAEIVDLRSRFKKIYTHVNVDYEPGSRMILDAVLLALAEIASTQGKGVVILPEMRIGEKDGVLISCPISGYELCVGGNVDYMVIGYNDVSDYKARLLDSGGSSIALECSRGCLFLVEAKCMNPEHGLTSHVPEAVGQAIALLKSENLPEVRFCLSDGHGWIFLIVKSEDGALAYYQSQTRYLSRKIVEDSDLPLREIVQLVREWLRPTKTGVYTLRGY